MTDIVNFYFSRVMLLLTELMRVWDVSSYVIIFISVCFLVENKMWFIHLYIGQNQNDTCANIHGVVPHEVTCDPTDDAAHDDELSNSFASSCCVCNHGSHFMFNQMHNHQNKYPHSNSANAVQQFQPICTMLPPFAHKHDQNQHHMNVPMTHYNHKLYHQLQHMNPKMYYSTNQSFQNAPTAKQITQKDWIEILCFT